MYDVDRKVYICDECGMIADPMVVHKDRQCCEGCAPNEETPMEWLQSHLPADEAAERTMSRHDLRCIRLAIGGLCERDTWMPVITELHSLLWPDDDVERDPARDIVAAVRELLALTADMERQTDVQ